MDKRSYDSNFIIVVLDRLTRPLGVSLGCLASSRLSLCLSHRHHHRTYHHLGTNEKIGRNCLVLYRVAHRSLGHTQAFEADGCRENARGTESRIFNLEKERGDTRVITPEIVRVGELKASNRSLVACRLRGRVYAFISGFVAVKPETTTRLDCFECRCIDGRVRLSRNTG